MGKISASELVGPSSGWYARLNTVRTDSSRTGTPIGAIEVPSSVQSGVVAKPDHINPLILGINGSYANKYLKFTKEASAIDTVSVGQPIAGHDLIETRISQLEKICANCVDEKDIVNFSTTTHFVQSPNIAAGGVGPVLNPQEDGTPGAADSVISHSTFVTTFCSNDSTCQTGSDYFTTCATTKNTTFNFTGFSTQHFGFTSYQTHTLNGDCHTQHTYSDFGNFSHCTTYSQSENSTTSFGYTEATSECATNSTNTLYFNTYSFSVGNSKCKTTATYATQFVGYSVQNDK